MKTAAMIIGAIILVGCAAGLIITYQSLASTHDTLEETRETLQQTQAQLQDTTDSLEATQTVLEETASSLEVTANNLEETQKDLEDQKSQTEEYVELYEGGLKKIDDLNEELDDINYKYTALQQVNRGLQNSVDALEEELSLYQDTLGTQVFSGVTPPYRSGNLFIIDLVNQSYAENPEYQELLQFLRQDKTDRNLYVPGMYECGNFAQDLHNNAEAAGIRTAFVAIHFYEGASHACNAFKTNNRGLVYIDDTGYESNSGITYIDKIVELAKDQPYNDQFLFPEFWYTINDNRKVKSIEIYW